MADAAQLAVTENGTEYKHPLHNTWTLWYFKIEKSREWSENQRRVASFSTAEDFWAYVPFVIEYSTVAGMFFKTFMLYIVHLVILNNTNRRSRFPGRRCPRVEQFAVVCHVIIVTVDFQTTFEDILICNFVVYRTCCLFSVCYMCLQFMD